MTVLAGLDEGVELVRVVGEFVGLEDDELAAADDDGGFALDGGIGEFAQLAFRLADSAGFHNGLILVWNEAGVNRSGIKCKVHSLEEGRRPALSLGQPQSLVVGKNFVCGEKARFSSCSHEPLNP